jgi:imidazolonepropionase
MSETNFVLTDCHVATMLPGCDAYGAIVDGAIAIREGRIAWTGPGADLPTRLRDEATVLRLDGRWITPALIDPHTHLVFAGTRTREFEARRKGASYAEIAAAGGGILSTVRATRDASEDELVALAAARLELLARDGAGLVEIKSGYGLDQETEFKMLRAARSAGVKANVRVRTTYLGLHALPEEWRDDRSGYVTTVCEDVLPALAAARLADSVDAFCEAGAFTPDEVARFFDAARRLGFKTKLHADQLSDGGGAALAARYGALSADHIEYTSEAGVAAMAAAGTVAVLLPGAYYTLRETQCPPVAALRAASVPIALASDLNPGTSPITSLLTILNMGVTLFGLSPEEALAGLTREAARALGMQTETGTLEAGKRADIAVWDIDHPAELSYWLGRRLCHRRFLGDGPYQ